MTTFMANDLSKPSVCYVTMSFKMRPSSLITQRVGVDCSMATRSDEVILQTGERQSAAADAVSSLYTPFHTLTALAVETGQAVRQTFGESEVKTSGHVEQGSQHVALPKNDDRLHLSPEPEALDLFTDGQVNAAQRRAKVSPVGVDPEAVRADIDRVRRKTLSADAATEVVLRFNFMGGRESKVRKSCLPAGCCRNKNQLSTTLSRCGCRLHCSLWHFQYLPELLL